MILPFIFLAILYIALAVIFIAGSIVALLAKNKIKKIIDKIKNRSRVKIEVKFVEKSHI